MQPIARIWKGSGVKNGESNYEVHTIYHHCSKNKEMRYSYEVIPKRFLWNSITSLNVKETKVVCGVPFSVYVHDMRSVFFGAVL